MKDQERAEPLNFLGAPFLICSPAMRELMALTERIARTKAAVLINGETGSGKELTARAIHCYSTRSSKPWVDVSCGALPEHLVESEFFGYEKGAFSSAEAPKPGFFELANGGTLFLDEIGQLEPRMQGKLLRVLDGNPYYRLGGIRKVTVDVRIVAATNVNLVEAVQSGQFRSDLFHRLSQFTLTVPPLRQRREDIIPLAEFFLEREHPGLQLSPEAGLLLQRYSWPGNVRQLRNVITTAAILASGTCIRADDLPPQIRFPEADTTEHRLEDVERRTIFATLASAKGHRREAAAQLGISARTLSRKLKAYSKDEASIAC